ncbi:hypothetical protein ACU4GG_00210 [Streptomyces nojiriensis]
MPGVPVPDGGGLSALIQGAGQVPVRGPRGVEFCLPLFQRPGQIDVALFEPGDAVVELGDIARRPETGSPSDFFAKRSFLGELHVRGYDLIMGGYNDKVTNLSDQADAVLQAISWAVRYKRGSARLVVGGVGRGALAARYVLAKAEQDSIDHDTTVYVSYNGTAPSSGEGAELKRLGVGRSGPSSSSWSAPTSPAS